MRRGLVMLAGALAASAPVLALTAQEKPAAPTKGEAELAQLLEGREAGAPVRCIRRIGSGQPMHTINGTAYIFREGDTLYVQRTTRPQDISKRFGLSIKRLGTTSAVEMCRTDLAETFDRGLGVPRASVIFENFIPYRRIRQE